MKWEVRVLQIQLKETKEQFNNKQALFSKFRRQYRSSMLKSNRTNRALAQEIAKPQAVVREHTIHKEHLQERLTENSVRAGTEAKTASEEKFKQP